MDADDAEPSQQPAQPAEPQAVAERLLAVAEAAALSQLAEAPSLRGAADARRLRQAAILAQGLSFIEAGMPAERAQQLDEARRFLSSFPRAG